MRCFRCFKPTRVDQDSPVKLESEEEQGKLVLKSLVNTIAVDSGNYTHRLIADEILQISSGKPRIRVFTYAEVLDATKNFDADNVIGEGGFGKVYKGYLTDIKQDIAVKQLKKNGLQGNREFLVEALMLSLLHHENLVNLIGYCAEEDQRILIYEHMALGSLEEHLLDLSPNQKPLSWETRMKIAEGAARGLEYLHETANPPIIYRDYKASNLLLDANYNPKLSDFGLAKVGPIGSKTHVTTRVMGTYGYCAPEYALTGQLTTMSDVYSFGVVFLEIISGRRVIDTSRPEDEQNLVQWAEPRLRDKKKFTELADPLLKGNYPMKDLYKALAVAAMCLQDDAGARPAISDVVSALQYLVAPKDCKESKDSKLFSHDQENEAGNATRNEATSHFHVTSLGKRQTSTREELVQQ